jgi:hypothetical protein
MSRWSLWPSLGEAEKVIADLDVRAKDDLEIHVPISKLGQYAPDSLSISCRGDFIFGSPGFPPTQHDGDDLNV